MFIHFTLVMAQKLALTPAIVIKRLRYICMSLGSCYITSNTEILNFARKLLVLQPQNQNISMIRACLNYIPYCLFPAHFVTIQNHCIFFSH